jgi:steroid 5-alpha reductase family enzyme
VRLAAYGDFLVRWGLFLMASASWQTAVMSLIPPVVMSLLLTRGSGKRLSEAHMVQRPRFAAYAARTSGFFPTPPRGAR